MFVQTLFKVFTSFIVAGRHHILDPHFRPVDEGEWREADCHEHTESAVLQQFDVDVEERGWWFHVAQQLQSLDKLCMVEHDQIFSRQIAILLTLHDAKHVRYVNCRTAVNAKLIVNLENLSD